MGRRMAGKLDSKRKRQRNWKRYTKILKSCRLNNKKSIIINEEISRSQINEVKMEHRANNIRKNQNQRNIHRKYRRIDQGITIRIIIKRKTKRRRIRIVMVVSLVVAVEDRVEEVSLERVSSERAIARLAVICFDGYDHMNPV